jgi:membrane associated rhomboid family serine protease
MIPIRDDTPRYSTPFVTIFLLVLNVLVFLFELLQGQASRQEFIQAFGVVPTQIVASLGGDAAPGSSFSLLSLVTSMFLHGSWLHLIFNMWALWIFGDNIEDYLGHFQYLLFYLASGIAGSLLHIAFNLGSSIPSVGASGAIAGVMGAYFLLYPSARVLTLVPIIIFFSFIWLPAWVVLGYWFVVQFLSGAATAIAFSRESGGGVAVWAHVGGFISGMLLIKILPQRLPRSRYEYR